MGIIALTLWTATRQGVLEGCPLAAFPAYARILGRVVGKIACSLTMAMARLRAEADHPTLGHRMVRLQPITVSLPRPRPPRDPGGQRLGVPLSTTHVISASINGVGASRRLEMR